MGFFDSSFPKHKHKQKCVSMCDNFDPVCSSSPSRVSMYVHTLKHSYIHTYIHMSFGLLLQRNCMCICVLNVCLCVSLCVCVCAGVCMWATKLKVCFSQQWGQNCTPLPTPSGTKATSCLCSSHMTVCVCMCIFLYVCMYTMCMLCECVYLFGLIKFWATFCYLIVFHVVAIRV